MISHKFDEIIMFMEYAVPAGKRERALSLLEQFNSDKIAINLFHSFYSFLPEGVDDAINGITLVAAKQGIFLICATTLVDNYLYLVNQEQAEFLGTTAEGIWEEEVLEFFGYQNREASIKTLEDLARLPTYNPIRDNSNMCPVCAAAQGEFHTLGCPVEICPWCGGQLTNCSCRFTITGQNNLKNEGDLDAFHELLNQKGRVPFASDQRPAYPSNQQE